MSEKPQLDSDVSEKPGTSPKMPSDLAGEKVRNEGAAGRSESERALPQSVSRETSEESELTPEQKMLNDIMDRAMAKSQAELKEKRVETAPQEETPSPEKEDAPPPPPEKNKPSSAYVYLAVLFGAAFLMLLLAYFVQRRNNETAISALRSTMNLSQDELMEEIQGLEEEKQGLLTEKEALQAQMDELNAQLESANKQYEFLSGAYDKYVGYTSVLQALYAAEVRQEARDYDGAAAELTDIEYQYFVDTIGDYDAEMEHYNPEGLFLRPRFDALVEELTRRGALDEGWAGQEQAP